MYKINLSLRKNRFMIRYTGIFMKNEKNKYVVLLALVAILALIVFLIYHFFGDFFITILRILKHGDDQELQAFLNSQNELAGMFSVGLLCILQVASIFFPGMVIHIASGLVYGWWKAFLACYIGFVSGNVLVFFFARKFGNLMQNVLNIDKKAGWITSKINSTKPSFIFALACMIPGIPNGIIPYLAARTDIRVYQYAIAVACSCWIQILCNCFFGHFLIRGEYGFMIVSISLEITIILLAIWKRNWFLGKGQRTSA